MSTYSVVDRIAGACSEFDSSYAALSSKKEKQDNESKALSTVKQKLDNDLKALSEAEATLNTDKLQTEQRAASARYHMQSAITKEVAACMAVC